MEENSKAVCLVNCKKKITLCWEKWPSLWNPNECFISEAEKCNLWPSYGDKLKMQTVFYILNDQEVESGFSLEYKLNMMPAEWYCANLGYLAQKASQPQTDIVDMCPCQKKLEKTLELTEPTYSERPQICERGHHGSPQFQLTAVMWASSGHSNRKLPTCLQPPVQTPEQVFVIWG